MSLSLPRPGRRTTVLFTTIILILAAFAYYFLVYVKGNESEFVDRAYRVLDRKALNIQKKYEGYQNYLEFVYNSVDDSVSEVIQSGEYRRQLIQSLNRQISDLYDEADGLQNSYESKRKAGGTADYKDINSIYDRIDRLELRADKLTSGLDENVNDKIAEILEEATPENIKLDYYSNEDGSVYYQRLDRNYTDDAFTWYLDSEDGSFVSFSEGANTFVSALLVNGFFHEFMLLKEGYNYDNTGNKFNYSIVYQTFSNPIDLVSISPLLQSPHEKELHDDSVYLAMGPRMIRPVDVDLYNEGFKLMFHRMQVQGETYYLGGFVKTSDFRRESQKVEIFFLVLAILMILLLLISMPVLKLVFMSSIERLHIGNVVMVGGSIVLGVPIVLLIFFNIYEFVIQGNNEIDNNLEYLSRNMEASFLDELGTMVSILHQSDDLVASAKNKAGYIEKINGLDLSDYDEYNHVFWIDEYGVADSAMQRTLLRLGPSTIDVSARDYYREVMADRLWTLQVDSPQARYDFFLQSIISWNDFTNEVAVSIPSSVKGYPVAVMTSQLSSIMETILPVGYGFAIIDEDGLVKFHSNKDRVLQENFLDETSNSSSIRSAIYSRMPMNANLKYRNVNHRAHIQPVNTLPLYMVTFYNNEYRNVEIQGVVSISIILLFSSFIAVSIMIIILHLVQKRRSKLRIKNFLFHWMKPEEDRAVEYQFLSLLFLIIGLALLVMISSSSVREQDILFTFIITNAYLFLISFSWLSPKESTRYTDRPSERRDFNIAFVLFIIAADWVYAPFSSGQWWWIVYQIFLLGFVLFSRYWEKLVRASHARLPDIISRKKNVVHHSYNVFLFTWLLISSILPIFFIFMVAHNEEEIIWQKYNQLKIAEQYQSRIRSVDSRVEALKDDANRTEYFKSKLEGGIYLVVSCISTDKTVKVLPCSESNDNADFILSRIRPHYNELIVESKGLAFDESDESVMEWCFPDSTAKPLVQLDYQDNYGPSDRGEYSNILIKSNLDLLLFGQSHTQNRKWYDLPVCKQDTSKTATASLKKRQAKKVVDEYRSFFFASILLIMIGVYFLIDYCSSKIYGREYINFKNTLPLTIENFKRISIGDDSITHHKQRQIFLLGLPKSNKSNLLKNLQGNFYEADMMCVNDIDAWNELLLVDFQEYDGVIIENFEYGVSSHSVNRKRLQFLEKLASLHTYQVVISSNVHPSFITDFYATKLQEAELKNQNREEINQALETWRHILGGFIVVHNPIKENTKINSYLRSSWIKSEVYKQLFRMELNKGSFLPNLLPGIKDYFVKMKKNAGGDESRIDKEDIILRIQLLAESYYLGLWNTLSKQEKYIIYDLAKDRFVNINNKNGIRSLLEKGLLVYENELRIMNESFTNFVLSIIKKEEALKMEKEVRDKGAWSTISAVLGLAVLGILAFLFLGNPDFFQDFNALISVVIAIAGIIPRLGGLLSFGKSNTPLVEGD